MGNRRADGGEAFRTAKIVYKIKQQAAFDAQKDLRTHGFVAGNLSVHRMPTAELEWRK